MGWRCIVRPDRKSVVLIGGAWRDEFPASKIDYWLEFYRKMARKRPGQPTYGKAVEALEAAKKRIGDG